jgi:hypothetical protein
VNFLLIHAKLFLFFGDVFYLTSEQLEFIVFVFCFSPVVNFLNISGNAEKTKEATLLAPVTLPEAGACCLPISIPTENNEKRSR